MKVSNLVLATALLFAACKNHAQTMDSTKFKSEKVSKSAMITLDANVDKVFPLFGAFEERKWAKQFRLKTGIGQLPYIVTLLQTIKHKPI